MKNLDRSAINIAAKTFLVTKEDVVNPKGADWDRRTRSKEANALASKITNLINRRVREAAKNTTTKPAPKKNPMWDQTAQDTLEYEGGWH